MKILHSIILTLCLFLICNINFDEYVEDTPILIFGHCSSVYQFHKALNIGFLSCCGIGVENNSSFNIKDRATVITDKGKFELNNHIVFMHNASGLFFWNDLSFHGRWLPFAPIVFVYCKADRLWIYDRG